jgi:hypothetical protein
MEIVRPAASRADSRRVRARRRWPPSTPRPTLGAWPRAAVRESPATRARSSLSRPNWKSDDAAAHDARSRRPRRAFRECKVRGVKAVPAAAIVLAAAALLGCGGLSEALADAGDAAAETSQNDGRDVGPGCPESLPVEGSPCVYGAPSEGQGSTWECEYGSDPHCTSIAKCSYPANGSSTWSVARPDPSCSGNSATCPTAFDAGNGAACSVPTVCMFPPGECTCVECVAIPPCFPNPCGDVDGGTQWKCAAWLGPPPGCPSPRPLLGTPCSIPFQMCDADHFSIVCLDGYWALEGGGC